MWRVHLCQWRDGEGADTCAATLQGLPSGVSTLAVLSDVRVVSGEYGGTVRVWR